MISWTTRKEPGSGPPSADGSSTGLGVAKSPIRHVQPNASFIFLWRARLTLGGEIASDAALGHPCK